MRARLTCSLILVAAGLTACFSGTTSEPTVNLMFDAPEGTGLASFDIDRELDAVITQDAVLPPAAEVYGRVTDGFGTPLENAIVSFHQTSTSPALGRGTTSADGSYAADVPAGTWIARVRSEDAALGAAVSSVTVEDGGVVDLRFPRPIRARGIVYESDGFTPVPDAELSFTGVTTGATTTVTTGSSGEFVTSVVRDTYEVVITPTGVAGDAHLKERFTAPIRGGGILNFVLTRGIHLSGTVRRFLGPPLVNTDIRIRLSEESRFFPPAPVLSGDVDGTYTFELLPPEPLTFELQPPGDTGYPRQLITLDLTGPETQTLDLALSPGHVVSGKILRNDGVTPYAGATVRAVPASGSLPPEDDDESDTTDRDGHFAISVFAGIWDFLMIPGPPHELAAEVRSFPVAKDLILNVPLKPAVLLTGTVLAPDGTSPLEGVHVTIPDVPGASSVSNTAGFYSLPLPTGVHTLELAADRGSFKAVRLDPVPNVAVSPPGPVVRDLAISAATNGVRLVRGTVYADDGVTPVEGARVTATDNESGELIGAATSDSSGSYTLVLEQ